MKALGSPAIDSTQAQVKEGYRRSINSLRGLSVELSTIDRSFVRPFNMWCVQSETAIAEGNAPDWQALYDMFEIKTGSGQYYEEALQLVRNKCDEFNTFVEKSKQGLIGERHEGINPHSIRSTIGDLISTSQSVLPPAAVQSSTPPASAVRSKNPLYAAVANASKSSTPPKPALTKTGKAGK